jgi:hypothetical protein
MIQHNRAQTAMAREIREIPLTTERLNGAFHKPARGGPATMESVKPTRLALRSIGRLAGIYSSVPRRIMEATVK